MKINLVELGDSSLEDFDLRETDRHFVSESPRESPHLALLEVLLARRF